MNIVETRHKVFPILGEASSPTNNEDDDDYDDDDDDDKPRNDYDGHSGMNVLARDTALKR